jgi:hypothetical protein
MRIAVALFALCSVAHAQAPGQVAPGPVTPSVMARRWSVSLGLASEKLTADTDGKPDATFGLLELAGRFRLRAPLDVGLTFSGGSGLEGALDTVAFYAEVRYRFFASRPWNPHAALALGFASVANGDASSDARRGRGSLRLSAGIERRFGSFAVAAELRLLGIGENERSPAPETVTPAYQLSRHKLSGGAIALAATYYF